VGRDFEITSYFPHIELTARLVRRLFRSLAAVGLRVGAPDRERYPALDGLTPSAEGVHVVAKDLEWLLRSRTGAVERGYGIVPLHGRVAGVKERALGTLQLQARSSRYPQLDGLHLRLGDAVLRHPPAAGSDDPLGPGWRALLTWYAALCEELRIAYGYGDWEDLFLQSVVPPSRAQIATGVPDLLFRLNCFGPAVAQRLGKGRLLAAPAQAVVACRYGGVIVGGKLDYDGAGGATDGFAVTARYLGLRSRPTDAPPGPPEA
jgi:hypothetical protein